VTWRHFEEASPGAAIVLSLGDKEGRNEVTTSLFCLQEPLEGAKTRIFVDISMLNSPLWEDEAGKSVRSTCLVDVVEEAGEDAAY
jgi:hypothetical protein